MNHLKFLSVGLLVLAAARCSSKQTVGGPAGDMGAGADSSLGGGTGLGTGGSGISLPGGITLPGSSAGAAGMCTDPSCMMSGPTGVCGNAVIESGEVCDDGNSIPGDGCSGLCRVEANYACPEVGKACVSTIVCGDSVIGNGEGCDDGDAAAGDGCDANCQVEAGYGCATAGLACVPVASAVCGDGVINAGESCDDGGVLPTDGCTANCTLEPGFSCPVPGMQCQKDEYCGNGNLADTEQCDDGNPDPGDGCTGICTLETFYTCPTPGQLCVSTIVCGDSIVNGDEACDDGNKVSGDGCFLDCKTGEPGFTCPTAQGVGGACTPVLKAECGDSRLDFGEYCDDGNKTDTDGCTLLCQVTPGYTCPSAGQACSLIEWCGDGKLNLARGEQCDDGSKCDNNAACTTDTQCNGIGGGKCLPRGGDGCAAVCVLEADYACPQPGSPCVSTVVCGDGNVTGNETCDDKNAVATDGCASCQVVAGWECPLGGVCRAKQCGDGIKAGGEECDDKNTANSDGCSSKCLLENGYKCPTQGVACVPTVCNDNKKEGKEPCDDGNKVVGDGCNPFCELEPTCPSGGGACTSSCGDGIKLPKDAEECDDGNNVSGDGCSATCKAEAGFKCTDVLSSLGNTLRIPVTYRDFNREPKTGDTRHPDFEAYAGDDVTPKLVEATLGVNGKPVYTGICEFGKTFTLANCPYDEQTTSNAAFDQWYRDTPGVNLTTIDRLTLTKVGGQYEYLSGDFFPLDGKGWVAQDKEVPDSGHNFGFTSEVIYWFEYKGGEVLSFTGDDDVWVFINGKLAVDLGGLHGAVSGSVTLNAAKATQLGLVVGNVYEIVLFHAERHTDASNFNLTLGSFVTAKSSCVSVCGDAIVTASEACDLGTAKNTGAYGGCKNDCTLAPRCGDATLQTPSGEQCDDGVNLSTYGGAQQKCGPGCQWAPYCGDAEIGSGEQCDNGINNKSGDAYAGCSTSCVLGARCGDGVITNGEECDAGILNGTSQSTCEATCKLKCGNGSMEAGEQCDDGKASNTGGYGKCTNQCLLGPSCGDGVKQTANGEQCDDGKNDGSYGTCAPQCVLGPRCGDGSVQAGAGEICDAGANNQSVSSAYGKQLCTAACRPAPYCGNKAVDAGFAEVCDDGLNDGSAGSCSVDCKMAIPSVKCGNGILDAKEQCDAGAQNGTAQNTCDSRCRTKCGNGVKDSGEACDDGVNNGTYGSCTTTCQLAGYCGDNLKNGPEECDLGGSNQVNPYGPGLCTTACRNASKCGDGRIQIDSGEQCDGDPGCTSLCKWSIVR